jgi:hypothetical protein
MKFAKIAFYAAAVYGFLALIPQYFLESQIGRDAPPAVTHPEFFYGFIGVALVFQIIFIIIAREPVKYRPLMLVSVLEKISFAVPCIVLYLQNRLAAQMLAAGLIDLMLGLLFLTAYFKTKEN